MPNGIDAIWHNPYNYNSPDTIEFNYKKTTLEKRNVGSKASLCDLMNHYYNLSKNELELKLVEVQKYVKSELEEKIEQLTETKNKLESSFYSS